jgi:hypothetical protein
MFLKRTAPFQDWSEGSIKQIVQDAKWKKFKVF